MTEEEKRRFIEYLALEDELRRIDGRGTALYLYGTGCSYKGIARACVFNEDCDYMRDYVTSEIGDIAAINFNCVSSK